MSVLTKISSGARFTKQQNFAIYFLQFPVCPADATGCALLVLI